MPNFRNLVLTDFSIRGPTSGRLNVQILWVLPPHPATVFKYVCIYVYIYIYVDTYIYIYMADGQNHVPRVHIPMLSDPEGLDRTLDQDGGSGTMVPPVEALSSKPFQLLKTYSSD